MNKRSPKIIKLGVKFQNANNVAPFWSKLHQKKKGYKVRAFYILIRPPFPLILPKTTSRKIKIT